MGKGCSRTRSRWPTAVWRRGSFRPRGHRPSLGLRTPCFVLDRPCPVVARPCSVVARPCFVAGTPRIAAGWLGLVVRRLCLLAGRPGLVAGWPCLRVGRLGTVAPFVVCSSTCIYWKILGAVPGQTTGRGESGGDKREQSGLALSLVGKWRGKYSLSPC
jgi:hypothetical protein